MIKAYRNNMELTYNELKKRDVINIADGKCLGRITNVKLRFPQGVIVGIFVPGRKVRCFRLFDRTELYIEEKKILKIGGDVILVDLKCSDTCAPNVKVGQPIEKPRPPAPPPCPSFCPPKQEICGDIFGNCGENSGADEY
ncbi:MAG: YlmC/YmxH family sporulation protein [Clostridia bacterium]|nr:YlmC/YmxH family sporulation protein [Clostridia bacterium]